MVKMKKYCQIRGHENYIDTIMDSEEFLAKQLPDVGKWTFFDTAHTQITHNEYDDEVRFIMKTKI